MVTPPSNGTPAGRLPTSVIASTLLLLVIQLISISGTRGLPDEGGYPLNTSKIFRVNIFEDDGMLGLRAALGYNQLHQDRFSYLLGVGGPVLLLARPVMAGLGKIGLITRFEDPSLYQLYPLELGRAYKAFAVYQLLCFTIWLPLAGYLLLSRHVSRRAGCWGAWLLALTPFLTAFEPRIKPDTPALLFGLLSLHMGLSHFKQGQRSRLVWAWVLLGISNSIKFTCAPFAATLLLLCLIRSKQEKGGYAGNVLTAALAFLAAFVAANPLFLTGLGNIIRWLTQYTQVMHATQAPLDASQPILLTLAERLTDLGVFFGPALTWLYPALLVGGGVLWAMRRTSISAWQVLWLTCLLQIAYMLVVTGRAFLEMTYYQYTSAALGLLLTACTLDRLQGRLEAAPPWTARIANAALVLAVFGPLAWTGLSVLEYVTSPTNRQLAHEWVRRNLPGGCSIGVNIPADGQPVNQHLRFDPFEYAVVPVGEDLEKLASFKPSLLVLSNSDVYSPVREIPGYSPAAIFDAGRNLPRHQIGLYQDDSFLVYKSEAPSSPPPAKALAELSFGNAMRRDPDPAFQILEYNASRFYPISLELFRKSGSTILPFATEAFTGSIRYKSSPMAYVHHVGPLVLRLWGVKYILAALDGSFRENVLAQNYDLEPRDINSGDSGPQLYRFKGYRGPAFFVPDTPWDIKAPQRHLLRPDLLPNAGTLECGSGAQAMEVRLEVDSTVPADVLLKGTAGKRSFLLGPGRTLLHVPVGLAGPVEYEINPSVAGGEVHLLAASSRPFELQDDPQVSMTSCDPQYCFAQVDAAKPGRVLFAQAWHAHWLAEVDGRPAKPEPGPAGVVAVPVGAGKHDVSLRFVR